MSVYFYGCVTIDGYLADKNHGLNWLYETGTTEETDYETFYAGMDVTIMGRRTFAEIEKSGMAETAYPTTENYVFTHEKRSLPAGFTATSGDVADFIRSLGTEKNIWVIGGNTVLAPLLEQDMVDHLILQVAPVLLGDGVALFTQRERLQRFALQEVERYGAFVQMHFVKRS